MRHASSHGLAEQSGPLPSRTFTTEEYRQIMGRFVTGVAVVTMRDEDGPHGTTVNSFTSLSLDPALVLICLTNKSRSTAVILRSGAFAVNILSHAQQEMGTWFARADRGQGGESFANIAYRDGMTRSPLLTGSVAQIDCRLFRTVPAGDHTIFMGEVVDLGAGADHGPLAFHRGRFLPLAA